MPRASSPAKEASPLPLLQVWRNPWFDGLVFHRGTHFTHPYPRHWHDELHLCAYTAGSGYLECRGTTHLAVAGDLILTPPSEVHQNWVSDGQSVSFLSLYIDGHALTKAVFEITGRSDIAQLNLARMVRDEIPLKRHFFRTYSAMESCASRLETEAALLELVELLLATASSSARPAEPLSLQVKRARSYIVERASQSISLAELGKITDLSPFHLHRLFSRQTGMPPHAYQTLLRINRAKELLRSGLPLSEVAATTGFADQSHFTRHFRRLVGIPPGRYSAEFQPPPQERSRRAATASVTMLEA
jgi:AraC-like DNA-binding protein